MEKSKIKFVKMGCDIDEKAGLNHRIRTIIETDDNKYIFIELSCAHRFDMKYTKCATKEEYLKKYPYENYLYVDFFFRVDVPQDKYKNYSEDYKEELKNCYYTIEYTKENIIKFLQKYNKTITDYELTNENWLDDYCNTKGFYKLYDERLQHKIEPLKIVSMHGNVVRLKVLYTAWNYNKSVEYTETWESTLDLREIVTTPDGRNITVEERFIEQYGIDTLNILIEEYKEAQNERILQKPIILQCKNK